MPNPLILLSEKPVGFLAGRAARHHERWQRDQRVIKAGLTTLQKIIQSFLRIRLRLPRQCLIKNGQRYIKPYKPS